MMLLLEKRDGGSGRGWMLMLSTWGRGISDGAGRIEEVEVEVEIDGRYEVGGRFDRLGG